MKNFKLGLKVALGAIALASVSVHAAPKPNILVILADDLGYADVGFHAGGNDMRTPSIDKLARQGTVFKNAYVTTSFCGPSRASLLTGRYAETIGAQNNLPPNSYDLNEGVKTSEQFISKLLKNNGYHTGLVGKWHLGERARFHPNKRGFTEFWGFLGGGHQYFPSAYEPRYKALQRSGRADHDIPEYIQPLQYNGREVEAKEYLTDALSREGSKFIQRASRNNKPFFLLMSYNAPHTPLEAKPSDYAKFSHIANKDRRTYAAMVYSVDRGVNRLVNTLKSTGEYNNTLIVFLSDNGGKLTAGANNYPLRDGKASIHEGGARVPMVFHWPGKVPAGKKYNSIVSTLDLFPTFASLAGASLPNHKKIDGKNIWNNVLTNRADPNRIVYSLIHRNSYNEVSVRKGPWRAVTKRAGQWALYNVNNDIAEKRNIAGANRTVLTNLVNKGKQWSYSHQAPLWFYTPIAKNNWFSNHMPNYAQTFRIR